MIRLVALVSGLLCGAGFVLSGLYEPVLVDEIAERRSGPVALGLALFAFVAIAALLAPLSQRLSRPYLGGEDEPLPDWAGWKSLLAALVFGLGWGLSGYFPLAALVSAGALSPGAAIFLASVLSGMFLVDVALGKRKLGRARSGPIG